MAPDGMVPIEPTSSDSPGAKMAAMRMHWQRVATAVTLLTASAAAGQTGPVSSDPAASTLLREGSYLIQAHGTLVRDPQTNWWMFKIAPGDRNEQVDELTLLPCMLLESLEQLVEADPQHETVFDLTGQVFVYRGRTYLLPTHAPRLVAYRPPPPAEGEAAEGESAKPPAEEKSADSILRELDETVGPVLRSSRPDTAPPAASAPAQADLVAPGTLILWRRGWMVREPDGAWAFVFEADATGLSDPPMIIYPCLLLEQMELHRPRTDRSGLGGAILVSGRVEQYHARNYLLPTAYQVPYHRTPLRP
jgi:hypothetical protein